MVNTKFLLPVVLLFLILPASADLTVFASDVGTNYIVWNWDTGTNLTEMRIDGRLMCGYDSAIPSINVNGLPANSCHTIDLISDAGQYGNNTACVAATNMTFGGGGGGSSESGMNMNAVVGIAGGLVGGLIGAMFIAGRLRKRNN